MSWIKTITDDEATGEVNAIYEASRKLYGFVPNIRRALSLNPQALRAYTQLSGAVYHGGALKAEEREMIATVVSAANRCHYWTESHAEFLRRLTGDDKLVEHIKGDWRQAALDARTHAMLSFSEKLTRTPSEMKEADIATLRRHGLSDEQILAVALIAAFFNVATRIADALGVELDPQFTPGTPEYEAFTRAKKH